MKFCTVENENNPQLCTVKERRSLYSNTQAQYEFERFKGFNRNQKLCIVYISPIHTNRESQTPHIK